ncbi:unnamed protein product, partial [Polarella glacialis]
SPSATPALQSGKGSGRRCGGGRGYKGGKGRHLRPEQALDLPALEILADKPLANWGPATSYVDSDIVNVGGLTDYAASVLEPNSSEGDSINYDDPKYDDPRSDW